MRKRLLLKNVLLAFLPAICVMNPLGSVTARGQSVCLPAPRLLTTMPMGGKAGAEVEVTITGEHLEDVESLQFSSEKLIATPKVDGAGGVATNQFVVKIAEDAPEGLYEARVMTRLGISSSRIFSVGTLPEITRPAANTTLETAMDLPLNSICNATMSVRSVDHYRIEAKAGQRIVVNCGAQGIDSKLKPVLIVADEKGRDLFVERRGGALDFKVPTDGKYIVKVHDLTFQGGPYYFYRLVVRETPADSPLPLLPSTHAVSSFSWPPAGLAAQPAIADGEAGGKSVAVQKITLPCDVGGSFFPAADVDTYEFEAKKGEVWWVEVASERMGLPTDPSVLVQHVAQEGGVEKLTDVVELTDIPSPVKPSSNGYAYDGPPYNGGSTDILGKLEIKEDGLHRLQIRDLFGGTRNDDRNIYRLIIRQATPDFALVAWALHMELRNGDRNALSKPLALRGGATLALEVVAIRRDGFDGPIDLKVENLPPGVFASGLKIPPGQSRGIILFSAHENAPRGFGQATIVGSGEIGGQVATRPCRLASMAWPVSDAWSEIPSPRLLADIPVSVSGNELAPLSIAAKEKKTFEARVGEKLVIPLTHARRCEFSGATMKLNAFGDGFDKVPAFDISLAADSSEAVLDLAALKTVPGDYLIAFYGSAVAKYRHNPDAVIRLETAHKKAEQEVAALAAEAQRLAEVAKTVSTDGKPAAEQSAAAVAAKHQAAVAALAALAKQLTAATEAAKPKDIVDIVVSEPIAIRVQPAEAK